MKTEKPATSACSKIRELMDDFLASELSSNISLQVATHVETCTECSDELRFRQSARSLLRRSVESEKTSPDLRSRVLKTLKETRRRSWLAFWNWQWAFGTAASCAAAALIFVVGFQWKANRIYHDPAAQAAYIQNVSEGMPAIQKIGLADHVHCAFLRKYPQEYPKQPIAAQQLGPEIAALAMQVKEKLPLDYQIVLAHRCSYAGRHYIHFVMRSDDHLVSIVMTERAAGESFTGLSLVKAGDARIFQASAHQFQVSGFESGRYLAYIVSDLDQASSVRMAEDVAPLVSGALKNLKS